MHSSTTTVLSLAAIAVGLAASSACVSFPGVTGSGDGGGGASSSSSSSTTGSTGGGGSGAGSSTGTGAGSSVSSSSGVGGGGGGGCVDDIGSTCLEEAEAFGGDQAVLSNQGQTLVMEAISGDAWWEDTEGDFFFTNVTGSFAARVRVSVATSQELGFEVGGLLVRDNPEWVKFEAGRITPAAGGSANVATAGLLLGRTDDQYRSEHLGAATGEPYVLLSGPVWLGVCHVPTVGFAFLYRTTGSWTLHEQTPIDGSAGSSGVPTGPFGSFGEAVQVGLIAGDFLDANTPDTVATFEGFQIGPLSGTLAACEDALEALSGPPHCGFCLD